MFDPRQTYEMTCEEAELLMIPVWANDPGVTDKERAAFETHLLTCSACAEEYEETREIMSLVRDHWGPISQETRKLLGQAERPIQLQNQRSLSRRHTMTVEEGWEDLKRRIPELAQLEKRRKRLQLFRRVSAVAACLVIGVFIWMAFSIYSKPEIAQESVPKQAVFAPKASIKIELLSDNSNVIIPAGTEIKTTARELKTLVINGKHRMVMNADTSLSIEPFDQNGRLGCMAKLASGEIFAHVEHDDNPFVVSTTHGRAVIRGTAFDVKATDTSTTLVVTEGAVQFVSEKGVVEVAAGQKSTIVAKSAPTKPVPCNTTELTAWATGYKPNNTLADIKSAPDIYDVADLPLLAVQGSTDLEAIDYEDWIEKNRDWFKLEFPWIFQLKDALTKEGIEADYPELLIKTGDVWQFVCLDVPPARFSVIDPSSLLKTASHYGFDKQWLLGNAPVAESAMEKPILPKNNFAGLKAFERWLEYLDATKDLEPPTTIYSYHAGKYLGETRSLIWFAVRDGKYDLTDEERTKVLALLQEEVTAACKCQNDVLYPEDEQKPSCDDRCQEPVDRVVGYIETIKAVEERILEYEIGK